MENECQQLDDNYWCNYLDLLHNEIYTEYDTVFSIENVKNIITSDLSLYKKIAAINPLYDDKQLKSACLAFMLCSYVILCNL